MQAATVFITGSFPIKGTKNMVPKKSNSPHRMSTCPKAVLVAPKQSSIADYTSSFSVFPAEACETVGGEACSAQVFPEVKPETKSNVSKEKTSSEEVEREYLEYNEPKTVFRAEACDDLGGEFCQPDN